MKSRGWFFFIGFLLGIALGYAGAQESIQLKSKEIFMQVAGKIDEGIRDLLRRREKGAREAADDGVVTQRMQSVPPQADADKPIDAAGYIRQSVSIQDLAAKVSDEATNAAVISGKVLNSGAQRLPRVEATVFFLGTDTIVFDTRVPIVLKSPLGPASEQAFSVTVPNIPPTWTKGRVRAAITHITF
ncbi:MAG: hypothetical protein HY735_35880 [Verrucomicrobia bacterium]|nr:hypothetical protein [Verrucomicrobiota bacterium]